MSVISSTRIPQPNTHTWIHTNNSTRTHAPGVGVHYTYTHTSDTYWRHWYLTHTHMCYRNYKECTPGIDIAVQHAANSQGKLLFEFLWDGKCGYLPILRVQDWIKPVWGNIFILSLTYHGYAKQYALLFLSKWSFFRCKWTSSKISVDRLHNNIRYMENCSYRRTWLRALCVYLKHNEKLTSIYIFNIYNRYAELNDPTARRISDSHYEQDSWS